MTQTKKVIRAKVGPLPSSLAIAWPRETRGKLSPQDDDRRRGHDVSDLVISKRNASPRTRTAACLWVGIVSAMRWRSDGAYLMPRLDSPGMLKY